VFSSGYRIKHQNPLVLFPFGSGLVNFLHTCTCGARKRFWVACFAGYARKTCNPKTEKAREVGLVQEKTNNSQVLPFGDIFLDFLCGIACHPVQRRQFVDAGRANGFDGAEMQHQRFLALRTNAGDLIQDGLEGFL
jgi:hypothetical protein